MLRTLGFSLLELLISMAILSILLLLAVPSVKDVMSSYSVEAAAQEAGAGLMMARAEALRTGRRISFLMEADGSWKVCDSGSYLSGSGPCAEDSTHKPILKKSDKPGSTVTTTATISGAATALPAATSFSSTGLYSATNIDGSTSANAYSFSSTQSGVSSWNLAISVGGQIKLCKPSAPAGNSAAC